MTLVDDLVAAKSEQGVDMLALGEAIEQLESLHPRATQVIEMRLFGGHEMQQIADTLEVSLRTVHNDFKFGKAWLSKRLVESKGERASNLSLQNKPTNAADPEQGSRDDQNDRANDNIPFCESSDCDQHHKHTHQGQQTG